MKAINILGRVFGRLSVVGQLPAVKGRAFWRCACSCGGAIDVAGGDLRRGRVSHCGCVMPPTVHGNARRGHKASEYLVWIAMRQRCGNPNNKKFPDYGGRGISVCGRWDDYSAFAGDMGARPSRRHTIERIDTNGDYEPSNCRWATFKEQANNTRRNIRVSVGGEAMTLKQAVERFGGRYGTVLARVHAGVPVEQALGIAT